MTVHMQTEIAKLKKKILALVAGVEEAVKQSVQAISDRDAGLAQRIIDGDGDIDHAEVEIEEDCLKILALYQPVATDLRFVVAVLKINNDLERMGDLARNVAKRVVFLAERETLHELPVDYRPMAAKVKSMVKDSLDALVNSDTSLAQRIRHDDDDVDAQRRIIEKQIEAHIRDNPGQAEGLMRLASVARHLERIADMATNIAEDVIYMVEGEIVRHHFNE